MGIHFCKSKAYPSYIRIRVAMVCCLLLFLTACGKTTPGQQEPTNPAVDTGSDIVGNAVPEISYLFREVSVPAYSVPHESNERVWPQAMFFYGEDIARIVTVYQPEKDETRVSLQRFQLSDETWTDTPLDLPEGYYISECYLAQDGSIYTYLTEKETGKVFISVLAEDEFTPLVEVNSERENCCIDVDPQGDFVLYSVAQTKYYLIHEGMEKEVNTTYYIRGFTWNHKAGEAMFFQNDNTDPVAASMNGTCQTWEGKAIGAALVYSETTGVPYLVDTSGIYELGETSQKVCDFALNSYLLTDILDVRIRDGYYELIAGMDDGVYYVKIQEGHSPSEKEEMVLACGYINLSLQQAVARFNRSNPDYHITIWQMEDITKTDAYFSDLQKRFASGNGPDLMTNDSFESLESMIRNGYMAPVSSEIKTDALLKSCVDGVTRNGVVYGVPYDFTIKTVCYKDAFWSGHKAMTAEEFMKAVKTSGAQMVACGLDGADLAIQFFLWDTTDRTYLDLDAGISHLNEAPFLKVMEFAKQYRDRDNPDAYIYSEIEGEAEGWADGRVLAELIEIRDLQDMNYLEACFDGQPSICGYPKTAGNGHYVNVRSVYGNAASKHPEGVKQFQEFLISEQVQNQAVEWEMPIGGFMGNIPLLPSRLSSLHHLMEVDRYIKNQSTHHPGNGIVYKEKDLTREQLDLFEKICLNTCAYDSRLDVIGDIIREEMAPYLEGDKSAGDAAQIMHRRVQLYLDEQK